MKIGSCSPSATLSAKVALRASYCWRGWTVKSFVMSAMAFLFLFPCVAEAESSAYCSKKERTFYGNWTQAKKEWSEFNTYEKLANNFDKSTELSALYDPWLVCFYRPWFTAWKSGKTTQSFEQARVDGVEPVETCTDLMTCGPRPDWRSPKDKAAEAAVLKARKK